jgi:hypothetical protein
MTWEAPLWTRVSLELLEHHMVTRSSWSLACLADLQWNSLLTWRAISKYYPSITMSRIHVSHSRTLYRRPTAVCCQLRNFCLLICLLKTTQWSVYWKITCLQPKYSSPVRWFELFVRIKKLLLDDTQDAPSPIKSEAYGRTLISDLSCRWRASSERDGKADRVYWEETSSAHNSVWRRSCAAKASRLLSSSSYRKRV